MIKIRAPVQIEVDLNQFAINLRSIKKYIGPRKFCLPLKADAYGHGLIEIAKVAENEQIDYFAIARVDEGLKLREQNIHSIPILLLGPFFEDQIQYLDKYNIEPTISSLEQLSWVFSYCKNKNKNIAIHLKIDTGMNRIGASFDEGNKIYEKIISSKNKYVTIKSIYSHFSSSDEPGNEVNQKQMHLFDKFLRNKNKDILKHLSNSEGIINFPESMYDMVRPGLLSYGYFSNKKKESLMQGISPILSIKSRVGLIKHIRKGDGVSYNHLYKAKNDGKIAIIPIGYGDGYKYNLSNKAHVIIKDKKYRVIGKICMDLLIIDIGLDDISIGEEVILIGRSEKKNIWADEIASILNTHVYEVLCSFTQRVPIIYF